MGEFVVYGKGRVKKLMQEPNVDYSVSDVVAEIRKMMRDNPKEFVEVTVQGETLYHKRGQPLKKYRWKKQRKRAIAIGFDSDVPDDDD